MTLTAPRVKRIVNRYHERLRAHREAINLLNVYPVPDGDTGTNMALTVEAVAAEVADAESMADVSHAISHASLMGARGNSGVILSQILRGLADSFREGEAVGAAELVEGLKAASEAAYRAVLRPVEGTMLTVLREAAEAAAEAGTVPSADLATLLRRVYERAEESLRHTPELLPVLKKEGVVDAGGAGLLLLLAAFLEEVDDGEVELPEEIFTPAAVLTGAAPSPEPAAGDISSLRYEVMFFLEAEEGPVDAFRRAWGEIGDSIVVVGGEGVWNCHIHTDDAAAAIERALWDEVGQPLGRPFQIQITDLLEQSAAEGFHGTAEFDPLPEFAAAEVGVVPVVTGAGLSECFRRLGAQGVVAGGQSMNPSTGQLLEAVERVPAATVILLPNNKNIIPVAGQVDALTTKRVYVVPTRSVPQGLAALVHYLPGADAEDLVAGMQAAAGEVSSGAVTRAVRDAEVEVGSIRAGEWLGLAEDDIVVVAAELSDALRLLLDSIVAEDAELVTLFTGAEAEAAATEAAVEWLRLERAQVAVGVTRGDQPLYPYLVAVE